MPFKKGDPRPEGSGRKKGTPDKKSILVREILESHGINLVEQIIVRLPKLKTEEQVKALIQLIPYCYPKLTAITHSGSIESTEGANASVAEQLLTAAKIAAEVK